MQPASTLPIPHTLYTCAVLGNSVVCFAMWTHYVLQIWVEQNPKQFKSPCPSLQLLTCKTILLLGDLSVVLWRECCALHPAQDLHTTPQEPPSAGDTPLTWQCNTNWSHRVTCAGKMCQAILIMGAGELPIEMAGAESQGSFPVETWQCVKAVCRKIFSKSMIYLSAQDYYTHG